MDDERIIVETSIYKLKRISEKNEGPIVIYISNEGFGDSGKILYESVKQSTGVAFSFYELTVADWDSYLTPWKSDGIMKGRGFEGKAKDLLDSIKNQVIPVIKESSEMNIYCAGYSLAGLFSLWSLYESDIFDGAACCSGSLWYPGWLEFAGNNKLKRKCEVYLSLGEKEKNTKNPIMRDIESNMKQQYELLKQSDIVERLHIDWHEGGHFDNTDRRMEMGIEWLMNLGDGVLGSKTKLSEPRTPSPRFIISKRI